MFAVFVTNGGVGAVPKYTSYEVVPAEAVQVNEGVGETPVAPLAGATSTGAAGALEGGAEFTNAFNKLEAFTLPRPVAKSQAGVVAKAGAYDVFEVDRTPSACPFR
jgi:hypothetical protein